MEFRKWFFFKHNNIHNCVVVLFVDLSVHIMEGFGTLDHSKFQLIQQKQQWTKYTSVNGIYNLHMCLLLSSMFIYYRIQIVFDNHVFIAHHPFKQNHSYIVIDMCMNKLWYFRQTQHRNAINMNKSDDTVFFFRFTYFHQKLFFLAISRLHVSFYLTSPFCWSPSLKLKKKTFI